VARLVYIPTIAENNVRGGFLGHDNCVKLRNELPEEIRPLFVVGYHIGARLGELLDLRWDKADIKAGRITLDPGMIKNKEGRTLPVYGEMNAWILMQQTIQEQQLPDCDFVFQRRGQQIGEFYRSWRSACCRSGVPGLLFHDVRRAAVRNMVRAGISEKVAMKISGHKSRSVFDRYDIVNERDLIEAAAKLDHYINQTGTISGRISKSKAERGPPTNAKHPN